MSPIRYQLLFLGGFLFFSGQALAQPVTTVERVDLDRYLGKWFEIAAIPQYFQRMCVRDVTAEYAMNESGIAVTNRCMTAEGKASVAQGQARVVDVASQAKLEVTFVKIFGWQYLLGGDYWVIDLAADYRYAVVGHPSRKYAWVLARAPRLADQDLVLIDKHLKENGYDTCELFTTVQTEGLALKQPLCEAVKAK